MHPSTDHNGEGSGIARLGDFRFDRQSGDLISADGHTERLAPQPTALLSLLVDHAGTVVTRDQIRDVLWPDVTVDFTGSLHHCVRQIRSALGDSAKDPRFIETIPRRGYRLRADALMVEIQADPATSPPSGADVEAVSSPSESESVSSVSVSSRLEAKPQAGLGAEAVAAATMVAPTASRRTALGMVLALGLGGLAWSWVEPTKPALRIAIMSFADGGERGSNAERIGEQVLIDLTARRPDAAVVGPRSTDPLRANGNALREVAAVLDAGYILNAKHLDRTTLLVELIRTRDGKHIWVRGYDDLEDWSATAAEVTEAVATVVPPR